MTYFLEIFLKKEIFKKEDDVLYHVTEAMT